MKSVGLSILLFVLACVPFVGAYPQSSTATTSASVGEEFVGPFPSWANVKTSYGAVGDGTTDDTAALQKGLDELGQPGHSPVLFVPSGRYRITRTLTLDPRLFISIVGDDPADVSIVWDGASGGTMLSLNGVAYSRVTRLTFDGQRRASVAIDQSWDGQRPNFDTGNEYSDHVFVDVEYGIHGGFRGHGFAETSILRSHFIRNSKAGVALGNFNALDVWVRHATFDDCAIGITNEPGAGNFRVYDSVFRHSSVSDLLMQNTGVFSVRGNFSIGSKAFYTSLAAINHPASVEIQGNTILDPQDSRAIRLGNQGPGLLLDNIIRSLPAASGPVVAWRSAIDSDVVSVGNTFTVTAPVSANGRFVTVADRVVANASIDVAEPRLPGPWPNRHRRVVSVSPSADGAAIQDAIDAASQNGGRTIVHIPYGPHDISATLTIPPGDVQLVGDGYGTILKWTAAAKGPVVRIVGPTTATLRELQIDGAAKADGISIENIDQPGSRLYLEALQTRAGVETNLVLDQLRNATIDLVDFEHADTKGVSVTVLGSKATIFSGASSNNALSYDVSGGGRLVIRDTWYEGAVPARFANIHGIADFTVQASRAAIAAGQDRPAFTIADLTGRVALLDTHFDDRIAITGDGSRAEILALGLFREFSNLPIVEDSTAPAARTVMINSRQRARLQGLLSVGSFSVANLGQSDAQFIDRLLKDARERLSPGPLHDVPPGVSDLRMFRVWMSNGVNNLKFGAGVRR